MANDQDWGALADRIVREYHCDVMLWRGDAEGLKDRLRDEFAKAFRLGKDSREAEVIHLRTAGEISGKMTTTLRSIWKPMLATFVIGWLAGVVTASLWAS